jgi:zinc/manganese transport system permease protein
MMSAEFDLSLMIPALLAGILVLSIHVPLGQEVLKRGIIFIDLAIAQIAALGVIAAVVFGGQLSYWAIQLFAGFSALLGAVLIHYLEQCYSDTLEAIIGLLFVLAASGSLLLISYAPHGDALLHDLLVGQILWVNSQQLIWIAVLYSVLLLMWFKLKNKWPIIFYLVFSLAVTASVQLVGIYLVFASLILPALASRCIQRPAYQLLTAYGIGLLGYVLGLVASLQFDLPTGAVTVWTLLLAGLTSLFLRHVLIGSQIN